MRLPEVHVYTANYRFHREISVTIGHSNLIDVVYRQKDYRDTKTVAHVLSFTIMLFGHALETSFEYANYNKRE